jgi:hypothetical protein
LWLLLASHGDPSLAGLQLGTHTRAKRKREEMANVIQSQRKAAAKKE